MGVGVVVGVSVAAGVSVGCGVAVSVAVGFDATRGDSVNVMNQPFVRFEEEVYEIPETPI